MYTTPTLTLVRPHTPTLADEMDEARKADLSRLNAALSHDLSDYASAIAAGLTDNIHFTHNGHCPIRDARYCSGNDPACIDRWARLATTYTTLGELDAAEHARLMVARLTVWTTWDIECGDIGIPLETEEGEDDEEPLTVPTEWPAPTREPVPA